MKSLVDTQYFVKVSLYCMCEDFLNLNTVSSGKWESHQKTCEVFLHILLYF